MYRFVRDFQRIFKPNHTRGAPCQKVTQDKDDNKPEQPRHIKGHTQPFNVQRVDDAVQLEFHDTHDYSNSKQSSSHSIQSYGFGTGIVEGAVTGTAQLLSNSFRRLCIGRKNGEYDQRDRPVKKAQWLSDHVKETVLCSWLPTTSQTVLPEATNRLQNKFDIKTIKTESQLVSQNDTQEQNNEYQLAKSKVKAAAEQLFNLDPNNYAVDHLIAMDAWQRLDFNTAASILENTVHEFGTGEAAHKLGVCYEQGKGVVQDYKRAEDYYKLACKHGSAESMFNLALMQIKGKASKSENPIKLLKKAASRNLPQALSLLGTLHYHNNDIKKAVKYFKQAAANKDPDGCYYLGVCYDKGFGMEKNEIKAAEFYEYAALDNHSDAQYNLAVYHEQGHANFEADLNRAVHWYKRSAEGGNTEAKEYLRELRIGSKNFPISQSASSLIGQLCLRPNYLPRCHSEATVLNHSSGHHYVSGLSSFTIKSTESVSVAGEELPKFFLPDDTSSYSDWTDIQSTEHLHSTTPLNSTHLMLAMSSSSLHRPVIDDSFIQFS